METVVTKTAPIEGARELDASALAELFKLETLSPPGESNGWSCCVIICKTWTPGG